MPQYGEVNGHTIGVVMKMMVRRAIEEIRSQRRTFEAERKFNAAKSEDYVTSADRAAQGIYLKSIHECFPGYGIVAEEGELSVPCSIDGRDLYFTVDPLDGTKAFVRRQSTGIGTMIALVDGDEIIAAAVGDVCTEEIYYYRPGSDKVHRLSDYRDAESLFLKENLPLTSQYVLLRDDPETLTVEACQIARGLFKSLEVSGGSIGISFARLWKGEVGGLILSPGLDQPWDLMPVLGISNRLGYRFFEIHDGLHPFDPPVQPKSSVRKHETLVVHQSKIEALSGFRTGSAEKENSSGRAL